MSTSCKIQIALGAILLLSSTSVSSFAATNTVNPGKNQSVTEKIPEHLLAQYPEQKLPSIVYSPDKYDAEIQKIRSELAQYDRDSYLLTFEHILQIPGGEETLMNFCSYQPQNKVARCWLLLYDWIPRKSGYAMERQMAFTQYFHPLREQQYKVIPEPPGMRDSLERDSKKISAIMNKVVPFVRENYLQKGINLKNLPR